MRATRTKTLRYSSPPAKARQRRRAPVEQDPLLSQLKQLAAAGKEMTLRVLRAEPYNIPSVDLWLLQERCREIEIVGDGKTHRVVFRSAQPNKLVRVSAPVTAGPPRSAPQPIETTPAEPDELDEPGPAIEQPEAEPAPAAGEIIDLAHGAHAMDSESYDALLKELRGDRRIGARHGGSPHGRTARVRYPTIDIETGRNIEVEARLAELQGHPMGKRLSREQNRVIRATLRRPSPSQDVVPPTPLHRLSKNDNRQRPGDAAVVKEQRTYDLRLKHEKMENRRPVSANPLGEGKHPPLPVG